MPSSRVAEFENVELVKSRLGESLLRLHSVIAQSRRRQEELDQLLTDWQQQWSSRSDQIAQRLETLQVKLEELSPEPDPPRLSVVSQFGEARDGV